MSLLKKNTNNKGATFIEYSMVVIIVALGTWFGAGYGTRAFQAWVAGQDDAVRDSFNDPLIQAPNNFILPGCNCGWPEPQACAAWTCSATERYYLRFCAPPGCDPNVHSCVDDCDCCDVWQNQLCNDPVNCFGFPYSFRHQTRVCGTGPTPFPPCEPTSQCVFDPTCTFHCDVPANTPEGTFVGAPVEMKCPGWDVNIAPTNKGNVRVNGPGNCPGGVNHCAIYCIPPFIVTPIGGGYTACQCPPGSIQQGNTCVCPGGWAWRDGCAVNQCLKGSCAFGECQRNP